VFGSQLEAPAADGREIKAWNFGTRLDGHGFIPFQSAAKGQFASVALLDMDDRARMDKSIGEAHPPAAGPAPPPATH
jgi:hypothetical protein